MPRNARVCCLCGRSRGSGFDGKLVSLHHYKVDWPDSALLTSAWGKDPLQIGDVVCCAHFANHEVTVEPHRFREPNSIVYDTSSTFKRHSLSNRPEGSLARRKSLEADESETLRLERVQQLKDLVGQLTDSLAAAKAELRSIDPSVEFESECSSTSSSAAPASLIVNLEDADVMSGMCNFFRVETYNAFVQLASAYISQSPNAILDPTTKVRLFLYMLAQGTSSRAIARMLKVSQSVVCIWMEDCLEQLSPIFKRSVRPLTAKEWRDSCLRMRDTDSVVQRKFADRLYFFVDGTVLWHEEPTDPTISRALFNVKHNYRAWQFFIAVAPDGNIVYLSNNVEGGAVHDRLHWDTSSAIGHMEECYSQMRLKRDESRWLGGDKAYPFALLPKKFSWSITKSGKTTTDEDGDVAEEALSLEGRVEFDPAIAQFRYEVLMAS